MLLEGERTKRHLSVQQEVALIDKINSYSQRGTHLTPQHIRQLAVAISEEKIGRNWASSFLRRHKEDLSSKYFKIQEASRMKSDTGANRKAFYTLVKAAYDDYHYLSSNIFNMDEAPFNMSTDRKVKRVAPKYKPTTSQAALANDCHITVVATISTSDAPVPPFLIYSGEYFIEEWADVKDKDPLLMAAVSKTGYNNSYYMMNQTLRALDRTVRRGEIDLKTAFMKTQRALDKSFAEVALIGEDTRKRKAAEELDKEVQGTGKCTRYPQGQVFDPGYKREHAAELAERKKKQLEERRKKAAAELRNKQGEGSKRENACRRPTSRATPKHYSTACLELEECDEE
ncbi:uncharacterized protein L199_008583 [Kwoniella botswanensis]|uniref:uncharacterized protein n=1 Tax=Kwoniella botswanensis TaxID=1268659 RepID=UPI00315C784F